METAFKVCDWYDRQCLLDKNNHLEPWKSKILKIYKREHIKEDFDITTDF